MIRNVYINGIKLNEIEPEEWLPLKKEYSADFVIKMSDTSMEPTLPYNSFLYILSTENIEQSVSKVGFFYLNKFDTFVIRQFVRKGGSFILQPHNIELFKVIEFNYQIKLLGIVTDCFWHIGN